MMPIRIDRLDERRAFRLTLALVAAATVARAAVAAAIGLGDAEAFYWCYARHLAAGYLEHPPGIALLIRASTALFGDAPLGVRLPSLVCTAAATLALAALAARRAATWRAGLATALLLTAAPALYAGGLSASPDPAFAAAWCVLLLLVDVALASAAAAPPRADAALLGAGAALGLAFEAKHFGIFALPALALLLALDARARALARRPAFLGAAALATAAAAPNVLWNAAQGWPTLANRFVWQQGGAGFSPLNLLRLAGGQLAYLSPLVWLGLMALLPRLWRALRPAAAPGAGCADDVARDRALAALALVPLALSYLVAAWTPRAEPHWPLVGTYALFAAAGPAWLAAPPGGRVRRFGRAAVWVAAGVVAALHVLVLTNVAVGLFAEPRHDLSNELVGWDAVAARVRAARAPGEPVTSYHYTMCAQLSYALREDLPCLSPRTDDFDFWGAGALPPGARTFLFVGDNRYDELPAALYPWARCGPAPILESRITRAGHLVRTFRIWRCAA
jgi:4-amino-4-deoxy-L-arabinose transferase-like glycosyltransferase